MSPITWRDEYSVGLPDVDHEHRELIAMINELAASLGPGSDRAHPLQQAWAAEQVSQCGRCDPGFIMALAALMRATPNPTPEQLSALPNICRCGATPRILKAIARAATAATPALPQVKAPVVQQPEPS